jgi:hypothetical protein
MARETRAFRTRFVEHVFLMRTARRARNQREKWLLNIGSTSSSQQADNPCECNHPSRHSDKLIAHTAACLVHARPKPITHGTNRRPHERFKEYAVIRCLAQCSIGIIEAAPLSQPPTSVAQPTPSLDTSAASLAFRRALQARHTQQTSAPTRAGYPHPTQNPPLGGAHGFGFGGTPDL